MKKLKLLLLLTITNIAFVNAQYSINGKITDEQNQPLPFANVILSKAKSKSMPKGVISDENGDYSFDNINKGLYQIEVSMLGFESKKSEEFQLSENKKMDFIVKEENQTLNEVVVTSKRPVIKQTAEKLIVDLENSEMINSSLQDVMKKIPGVLVTNNGISVAGNSGVRILINGKTTEYMDVESLLRDLPADNISKVEVVEQPGSEYDASGSGAIINIILKKNVKLGTHGSVNTWIGEDQGFEYGTRASIASYKNKINWQTSIGYSEPTWRDDLFLKRNVGDTIYDQTTISPFKPENFNISGNLDYFINDKHSIGIGSKWTTRTSDRIATSETIVSDLTDTNTLFSENSIDLERDVFNINPYYEYKTEKNQLNLDFNYIKYKTNNNNNLSDTNGSTIEYSNRRYLQDGQYTIKTYKADYIKTFNDDFKLSFGTKYAKVNTDSDLASFEQNSIGDYIYLADESSRFLVEETIFSFYTKINASVGDWSFSGGLRYEDSDTQGTSIFTLDDNLTQTIQTRPISKIFPSASVSKKLTENLGTSLSYSYRIQRPSYNTLNSFVTYLDPYSAEIGNPNLKPSFTNKYQFNLTYDGQPFFGIGYSETNDAIFDLIKQDNVTAEITQQEVNIENNTNWNFRLFGPLDFIDKLDGYTGFIVVNTNYESAIHNIDLSQWNLYWFIQANYKLPWDINFEMNGNYGTGALEGQINVDWLAELGFSFGKKFMKDKLKVNLGFNKILNRGFVGNIDYGNGKASVESNGSRQNIQLKLTYSFGSKFSKKRNKKNASKDEENRINDNN